MTTQTLPSLPAQPLLTAIRNRGGLMALFPSVEKRIPVARKGGKGIGSGLGTREFISRDMVAPEHKREFHSTQRQLERAREAGRITVRAADEICCRLLNLHPYDVFGDAYFDLT